MMIYKAFCFDDMQHYVLMIYTALPWYYIAIEQKYYITVCWLLTYLMLIQNGKETEKWFYTDLWVGEGYRRLGNAKRLITAGCNYLSNIGAKYLMCAVEGQNIPSINTQISLGFKKIDSEPFEFFDNADLLMFFKELN